MDGCWGCWWVGEEAVVVMVVVGEGGLEASRAEGDEGRDDSEGERDPVEAIIAPYSSRLFRNMRRLSL